MYNIIKNVIETKNYELSGILKKLDTLWVQDKLTDEKFFELCSLARENADFAKSVDVVSKLEEFEKRISALEGDSAEQYSEYSAGKWYYAGDKVTFENKLYCCTAPSGSVCTWSPYEYPAFWQQM